LAVHRTVSHIYAQVIDDDLARTICAASTRSAECKELGGKTGNRAAAAKVGELIAQRAKEAGISKVVFDRGGFLFHGRVKAVADGARKGGLVF
jgi:large subunit ribosomal protein L18